VEYATREQAQQAIQTLSNQSLMGRLVYVREVWASFLCPPNGQKPLTTAVLTRIARQSLDLPAHHNVATTAEVHEEVDLVEAMVVAITAVAWAAVVEADNSTSPMSVLRALNSVYPLRIC
jgi:hypothetical protein